MKKLVKLSLLSVVILASSCVSKKKYTSLENQYNETRSTLAKTQMEKEEIESKYARIEGRVAEYNAKIQSLSDSNNKRLQNIDGVVISENEKQKMRQALKNVDPNKLAQAKTLKDSMNLIVSYNLKKNLDSSVGNEAEADDIDITIDETVVMITISDKLLFRSGSSVVNPKANNLLKKLADVINSEPAMEVLIEGHTDNQKVKPGSYVKDNWELSVARSTAVIRKLQNDYKVNPEKLIAAGRSSYHPVNENDSAENRAKNRRTRIVILPNLDKFLALLSES